MAAVSATGTSTFSLTLWVSGEGGGQRPGHGSLPAAFACGLWHWHLLQNWAEGRRGSATSGRGSICFCGHRRVSVFKQSCSLTPNANHWGALVFNFPGFKGAPKINSVFLKERSLNSGSLRSEAKWWGVMKESVRTPEHRKHPHPVELNWLQGVPTSNAVFSLLFFSFNSSLMYTSFSSRRMLSSLWAQSYSLGSSNPFEHKPCPPGEQKTHLTHTWSQEHSHVAGMNNDQIYWRPKKDIVLFTFLILYIFSINVCSKYNHFCVQILDICGYKRELLSKNILGYPLSCWKTRPLLDFWGSDPLWWQSWQLCPNTFASGCRWLLTLEVQILDGTNHVSGAH